MWRLQLITNVEFVSSINSSEKLELCLETANKLDIYPDDQLSEYSSDEEAQNASTSSKRSKNNKSRKSESSEGSGSANTTGGSSTGKSSRRSRRTTAAPPSPPNDFIGLMLSAPDSLLAQCILKGDFKKSKEVIQLASYNDVSVRVCTNCYDQTLSNTTPPDLNVLDGPQYPTVHEQSAEWLLGECEEHNHTVRGEFSYKHAPSVSLCLTILGLHSNNVQSPAFLLTQCDAIVRLLRPKAAGEPNSEIDYTLLIKMMRSMALAAKVKYSDLIQMQYSISEAEDTVAAIDYDDYRQLSPVSSTAYTGTSRCETILTFADLANLLVEHGCAGLIPSTTLSGHGMRHLRDLLVRTERWAVALELSLKAGLGCGSVLASWGKACLRAGTFESAREKFKHCLTVVTDAPVHSPTSPHVLHIADTKPKLPYFNFDSPATSPTHILTKSVSKSSLTSNHSPVRRPANNSPLLNEILNILETSSYTINPSVIKTVEKIKTSQSHVTQNKSAKNFKNNFSEPAVNILHTLANLKNVSNGIYGGAVKSDAAKQTKNKLLKFASKPEKNDVNASSLTGGGFRHLDPFFFQECMYYLTTYGSHGSILDFHLKHSGLKVVLEYTLNKNVDFEVFTEVVYMNCLKQGNIETLHTQIMEMDDSLNIWKELLTFICRYLEKSTLLNTLYQLQIFMSDYIRASMTCIRFYQQSCKTYSNLQANVDYLNTAERHLQHELEKSQWVHVPAASPSEPFDYDNATVKKMSSRELDRHINTISRQKEVTKFLAMCEAAGRDTTLKLPQIFSRTSEASVLTADPSPLPTLFGSQSERSKVAVLTILCGQNVEEGFGLAFRIIQDYQLNSSRIYCLVCKYLSSLGLYSQIEQLCCCIQTSGSSKSTTNAICDEVAELAIKIMSSKWNEEGSKFDITAAEGLIKMVQDVGIKVSCYIETRQLKSAYLLAVKYNRMGDVRRIQREAERLGQNHIKSICAKRLEQKL